MFCKDNNRFSFIMGADQCGRGRVVKATDFKSVSLWEGRFEFYRLRTIKYFKRKPLDTVFESFKNPSYVYRIVAKIK